jgi:hypothetical protein
MECKIVHSWAWCGHEQLLSRNVFRDVSSILRKQIQEDILYLKDSAPEFVKLTLEAAQEYHVSNYYSLAIFQVYPVPWQQSKNWSSSLW